MLRSWTSTQMLRSNESYRCTTACRCKDNHFEMAPVEGFYKEKETTRIQCSFFHFPNLLLASVALRSKSADSPPTHYTHIQARGLMLHEQPFGQCEIRRCGTPLLSGSDIWICEFRFSCFVLFLQMSFPDGYSGDGSPWL